MLAFERTLIGYSISYRIVSYRISKVSVFVWDPGPMASWSPNVISIGSSVSAELTIKTNRHKDNTCRDNSSRYIHAAYSDTVRQPSRCNRCLLCQRCAQQSVILMPQANHPRRSEDLYCRMVWVQAPILAIRLSAQQVISPVVRLYWKSIFRHHFPGLLTMGPNFIELKISVYLLLTNVYACQRLCYRKAAKHLIVELGSDTESQNFR